MRILYLPIKGEWFDKIFAGTKTKEFRKISPFYDRRLNKEYDFVFFRAGYNNACPQMLVEFKGCIIEGNQYVIDLGRIVEYKNIKNIGKILS